MKNNNELLTKVNNLILAHKQGLLGGEKMPEDENPGLDRDSMQNYMYFTLPMALNYQRNSYVLWECANKMYTDKDARVVFDSKEVCAMPEELLRKYLVEVKLLTADRDSTIDFVGHTVNAVSALHERNKSKRAHNVITDWGKGLKTEETVHGYVLISQMQRDALF